MTWRAARIGKKSQEDQKIRKFLLGELPQLRSVVPAQRNRYDGFSPPSLLTF